MTLRGCRIQKQDGLRSHTCPCDYNHSGSSHTPSTVCHWKSMSQMQGTMCTGAPPPNTKPWAFTKNVSCPRLP